MPEDKYNGLYIEQALVKGNYYGFSSGPKPETYSGNIDTAADLENGLEDLRNKALYILSPNESNGRFPVYGHSCTVITTRYGDDIYFQRLFDINANVEWERIKVSGNDWSAWNRITSYGDANDIANKAYNQSGVNADEITKIKTKIDFSNSKTIASRVSANESSITSISSDYKSKDNELQTQINSLKEGSANDRVARDHTNKMVNNDVRSGQLPGIKFYANTNEYTVVDANSVQIIAADVCRNWGSNETNSVFFVCNANGTASPIHVEGGTYVPGSGWYAVWDGNYTGGMRINWMLVVFNQSIT